MIIINDKKALQKKCDFVSSLEDANNIISLLEKELKHSYEMGRPGIGLSAPQIGIYKCISIIRLIHNGNAYNLNLINAKIENKFDRFIMRKEGCLSFPNIELDTYRYKEIYVIDNIIKPYKFIATGLLSVCIQHELDHLDGILFFNHQIEK